MRKIIIHGATNIGKALYFRLDYIFDVVAFIDRSIAAKETNFCGVPIYGSFQLVPDKNVDFIFVMARDYDGVCDEYRKMRIPVKIKVLSMLYGHELNKQTLFFALANEIYRKKINGSVVELGVDFGDTAKYLNLVFEDRTFYLFDTFEGFPTDQVQYERSLGTMVEKMTDFYNDRSTQDKVLGKMFYPEKCVIKKGIFPDSLNGLEDNFALVHIDCDLSKPIYDALEYFYPRMSDGGYLCVHDYHNPNYPGVHQVVKDFVDKYNASMVPIPSYLGVVICK